LLGFIRQADYSIQNTAGQGQNPITTLAPRSLTSQATAELWELEWVLDSWNVRPRFWSRTKPSL